MQIELLKPHIHAGIACTPGALLALDTDLAMWLVDSGIARTVPVTVPEPETALTPTKRQESRFAQPQAGRQGDAHDCKDAGGRATPGAVAEGSAS